MVAIPDSYLVIANRFFQLPVRLPGHGVPCRQGFGPGSPCPYKKFFGNRYKVREEIVLIY